MTDREKYILESTGSNLSYAQKVGVIGNHILNSDDEDDDDYEESNRNKGNKEKELRVCLGSTKEEIEMTKDALRLGNGFGLLDMDIKWKGNPKYVTSHNDLSDFAL